MRFPTIDPKSEWTPLQLRAGYRVVGAEVNKHDPRVLNLVLQFAEAAKFVTVDVDLTFDAVSE